MPWKRLIGLRMIFSYRRGNRLIHIEADGIAYLLERDGKLVFDCLDRNVEDLGHFPVFQTVFLYKPENDLAFGRELFDRSFDKREHIGGDKQLFRVEIDAGEFGLEFIDRIGYIPFVPRDIVERGDRKSTRLNSS